MKFPTDVSVSQEAKDLMRSLLTESEQRLSYEGLGCHRFFNGIDWTKLAKSMFLKL